MNRKLEIGTPVKHRVKVLDESILKNSSYVISANKDYVIYYGRIAKCKNAEKVRKREANFYYDFCTPSNELFAVNEFEIDVLTTEKDMKILRAFEAEAASYTEIYNGLINKDSIHSFLPIPFDKLGLFCNYGTKFKVLKPLRNRETYKYAKICGWKPSYGELKIYIGYNSFNMMKGGKQEYDVTDVKNVVPLLYKFDDLVNEIDYHGRHDLNKIIPVIKLAEIALNDDSIRLKCDVRIEINNECIIVHSNRDQRSFVIDRSNWSMSITGLHVPHNNTELYFWLYKLQFAVGLTESQYIPKTDDIVINEDIHNRVKKENELLLLEPTDIDTYKPFLGSKLQNLELEACARALVSHLATAKKSFYETFTLADMGNISYLQLKPLVDEDCVEITNRTNGNPDKFIVTAKFIDIVSVFKKVAKVTV